MEKIRLGVIGCGSITQFAHLPAALKSEYVTVQALCDKAEDLLTAVADQYRVQQRYTDYHELLNNRDIDAVIIAVPDRFHIPIARECIAAGKHILIEKPVSDSVEQAEELVDLLRIYDVKVQVGNMKRFDPGIQYAKEFIQEKMGDLFSINGWYCDSAVRYELQDSLLPPLTTSQQIDPATDKKNMDKEKYYFETHGVHLINTIQYLGGPISRINGRLVIKDDTYSWHAMAEFEKQAVGNIELTIKINANWYEGFAVHGKNGSVFGRTYLPFFKRPSDVEAFELAKRVTTVPLGADSDVYKKQLDSFARVINDDLQPVCTIDDGIQDIKVLAAFARSVESNKWEDVKWS